MKFNALSRPRYSGSKVYPSLVVETLERLRLGFEWEHGQSRRDWLDLLALTSRQYQAFVLGEKSLSRSSLNRLAAKIDVDPDEILAGELDFRDLCLHFSQRGSELPDRYRVASFGRRRTTITSLDFVEEHFGWNVRHQTLRHFKLGEGALALPMAPISSRFPTDLCEYLARAHGLGLADFFRMGAHSQKANLGTLIDDVFSRSRGPRELYETFFGDMMKFFEQNSIYSIRSLGDEHCQVEMASQPDVSAALGVTHLGSEAICRLKSGIFISAMGYLDLPYAQVEETRCVHLGDDVCRFEIDFSLAAQAWEVKITQTSEPVGRLNSGDRYFRGTKAMRKVTPSRSFVRIDI